MQTAALAPPLACAGLPQLLRQQQSPLPVLRHLHQLFKRALPGIARNGRREAVQTRAAGTPRPPDKSRGCKRIEGAGDRQLGVAEHPRDLFGAGEICSVAMNKSQYIPLDKSGYVQIKQTLA